MRVMELMKQRCRRVLEWVAAVTVPCNSFSLYFTTSEYSSSSRLQQPRKNAETQKNEKA